nr:hypothetical protein [Tanacetum cinerariifolium]
MADMTAPSGQAPTVAPPDEKIMPHIRWVQIGKSNCSLDLDKKKSNPIFKMAMDLLMYTNFYRAFTASSTILSIYIQLHTGKHLRSFILPGISRKWSVTSFGTMISFTDAFSASSSDKNWNLLLCLKTRRIFCNLESFVGGRLREGDYRLLNQNWRDLPRDNPLVRVEVLRKDSKKEKCKNKGRVPTEMELELEHTQQGSSYEVSWVFNSLVHSIRALSALRRSGLRMASTAAKPCQGDSSKFYLITGSIYTDQRGTVVLATLFNESKQRRFSLFITNMKLQESRQLQLLAKEMSIHNSMRTL